MFNYTRKGIAEESFPLQLHLILLFCTFSLLSPSCTSAEDFPAENNSSPERISSSKGTTALDILNRDTDPRQYASPPPSDSSGSTDALTVEDIFNMSSGGVDNLFASEPVGGSEGMTTLDSLLSAATGFTVEASFTPEPLGFAETMTAPALLNRDPAGRCGWYREKIGRFVSDINRIGVQEGVPPKLLAAIVLNEMSDVDNTDVVQDQQLAGTKGDYGEYQSSLRVALWWKSIAGQSFGIAQISPETALEYNAVHIPPSLRQRMTRENEVELFVAYRLLDRRLAMKAAAKIIKGILVKIEKQQHKSAWVKQFITPGKKFSAGNPYAAMFPVTPRNGGQITPYITQEREKYLTQLVTAIYNSGDIIIAQNVPDANADVVSSYPNALKHSQNAKGMAEDLSLPKTCGIKLKQGAGNNTGITGIIAWINRFGTGNRSGRVHIGDQKAFDYKRRYRDELFAGMSSKYLTKERIFKGKTFATPAEARKFVCKAISNKRTRYVSGHGRYPMGEISGKPYYIDGLGCKIPKK